MAEIGLSVLLGNARKPLRVTTYTSGSGTFTPLVSNGIARVTVVGGGAGGGGAGGATDRYGAGGAGGETISLWMRLSESSYAYSVGAAGTGGANQTTNGAAGGTSYFGNIYATGGQVGRSNGNSGEVYGSEGGGFNYFDDAGGIGAVAQLSMHATSGGGGGLGDSATAGNGKAAGCPALYTISSGGSNTYWPNSGLGGADKGGGGGGSLYGKGGDGANGAAAGSDATGYGAGGGGAGTGAGTSTFAGGNGTGGLIIVEEWGAP